MTRAAFENALVVLTVLGGSTNAVLHLIAMARAVPDVPLSIDDFQRVSDRVPPAGGHEAQRHIRSGGPGPHRRNPGLDEISFWAKGCWTGSCLTVTGRTVAENLSPVAGFEPGQRIVRPLEDPIHPTGHIQILRGSLAPEGAVAKITGKEGVAFSGRANVFDSEEDMLKGPGGGAYSQRRRWW